MLAAFKAYYETAELEGVTDPNLVYDLRANGLGVHLDGDGAIHLELVVVP